MQDYEVHISCVEGEFESCLRESLLVGNTAGTRLVAEGEEWRRAPHPAGQEDELGTRLRSESR